MAKHWTEKMRRLLEDETMAKHWTEKNGGGCSRFVGMAKHWTEKNERGLLEVYRHGKTLESHLSVVTAAAAGTPRLQAISSRTR